MTQLSGYHQDTRLHRGNRHTVWRSRRRWDDLPVIFKTLTTRFPSAEQIARLRREYEFLRRLDGYGAPRPVALEVTEESATLIMTDGGGRTFEDLVRRGPLPVPRFLDVALAAIKALSAVHSAGILHRDISPGNCLLLSDDTVCLIDFAIAIDATTAATAEPTDLTEGDPAYMPPEQTGRLNRQVDHRSDLYALGGTFHMLLTGRPPFSGGDELDLIHAHISRPPPATSSINPRVPEALSRIILKLLSKAQEDRYQGLDGLTFDLNTCRHLLQTTGSIPDDLPIGTEDRSDQFRLPQKIYGRATEVAALAAALERTATGRIELALVSGPSGIGKSALVREVFRPLSVGNATIVSGKFEEFRRNVPYGAIADAFGQFIRLQLAGSEHSINALRTTLERALHDSGGVLVEALPELELLLGPQSPVPPLPPLETENRFSRIFRAFLGTMLGPTRPLVLVLDDLQWADRASLHLLQHILTGDDLHHMLVVGTYRDGDIDSAHPLPFLMDRMRTARLPLTQLHLKPLTGEDITALISETLSCSADDAGALAELCLEKTSGNAFFLSRFLESLHDSGLITFDRERRHWTWQVKDIANLDITANVVDLMVDKIRRLSPAGQRVVQRAACIGGRFDLETLSRINDVGPSETLDQLWEAIREGLIVPNGEAWRHFRRGARQASKEPEASSADSKAISAQHVDFRFLHDRVFQAAYSLIPKDDRSLRHLNVGRSLLAGINEEDLGERLFDIVDQLDRGAHLVTDPAFAKRIAHLNLEAARKAAGTAGYGSALTYAQAGLACLGATAWQDSPALAFDLSAEAAQAAYMLGDTPTTDALCQSILTSSQDTLERCRALEFKTLSLLMEGKAEQAIDTALDALRDLGFALPRHPGPVQRILSGIRLNLLVREASRTRGNRAPRHTLAPRLTRPAVRILTTILSATYISRPNLCVMISALHMRLALDLGDSGHIAFGYATHAVTASAAGHLRQALPSVVMALDEARRVAPGALTARTMVAVTFNAGHWQSPMRALRALADEAHAIALNSGDLTAASQAATTKVMAGFLAGIDLADLKADVTDAFKTLSRQKFDANLPSVTAISRAIENLVQPGDTPWILSGAHYDDEATHRKLSQTGNQIVLVQTLIARMTVAAIFGQWQVVRSTAAEVARHNPSYNTALARQTYEFLTALSWARDPDAGDQHRCLAVVRRTRNLFRHWVALGPANSLHRRQMLDAEEARLTGDTLLAAELYDRAIKTAHDTGFLHEQAMFNEIVAAFHDTRGRPMIAEAYRRQAHYRYGLWGAKAKVAQIEIAFPDTATPTGMAVPAGRRSEPMGIDLTAAMKAAQAISGEIHRPALIRKLLSITMGTAGAQHGILFLRNDDTWTIEAEANDSTGLFTLLSSPLPNDADMDEDTTRPRPRFARGVFNYCIRSGEPVVLHNAPEDGAFMTDPYVMAERPRSVLCLPLLQQADLRGVLYLENNLTAGAFTAERLEILRFLSAQMVISLENAVLYDDLSELNRTLEAEVTERSREATENSRLLEASLENMSDGLMAFSPDGHLLVWNDRATELLQIPAHLRRRGTPLTAVIEAVLMSGLLAPAAHAIVSRRHDDGIDPFPDTPTAEIALADGRYLQIRRTFMPDGGQVQIYLDVTAERRREQELDQARQAAETALEDLRDTQESLIQAEKMASLGQLVAGIAHEINTPIGITLTAASLLSEKARDITRALAEDTLRKSQLSQFVTQTAETTDLMLTNIQRAADLITGFKQVAVDQTSGDYRVFNMATYIGEVVRSFGPMLRRTAHHITVTCPDSLELQSYPGALSQILTNLTVNALTHAFDQNTSGTIDIVVRLLDTDTVELRFSDNGKGIPPELQTKVFDPFFTTRRGAGGSGLGLNIAFNLVSGALHGSLGLDSRPGEGTTFILVFPRITPTT